MDAMLLPQRFEGFGPSRFARGLEPPRSELALPRGRKLIRRLIRRHCLRQPGVYGMLDADGRLIYVGKSKSLRDRLLSYFGAEGPRSKARRIAARAKHLVWEAAPHEFAALLRELELIRRFLPLYNVKGRPRRRNRAFVTLGRGPASYAYLCPSPGRSDEAAFGPISGGRINRRLVEQLNDLFGLRNCSQKTAVAFAEQRTLFAAAAETRCLRGEMGNCLSPCAGRCTASDYAARVAAARRFLAGADLDLLRRIEAEMVAAAAGRQFERAAWLRDAGRGMRRLHEQLQRLRRLRRRYSFVYPLPDYVRGEAWHVVLRGQVVETLAQPVGRRQAAEALRRLAAVYSGRPQVEGQTPEDPDMLLLVFDFFRRYPDELRRVWRPAAVKGRLRGRTQTA